MRALAECRRDFPLIAGSEGIYFDSAATTQKPAAVIEALRTFYAEEYGTVHRAIYALAGRATERYYAARVTVQRFLNARLSEEIVFTKGTTEAINLVAASYGSLLEAGDEVIISEMEHHSNIVPWQLLAKRRGIVLRAIPMDEQGVLSMEHYQRLLSSRTKLVALAHIANATGTLNPVQEIVAAAHAHGAKVLLDGAQSAPYLPVDVQALDVDFFAFSGHKAFGPTGVGVLYGKEELLQAMPPYQGGGDMITRVTLDKTEFQPPPLRFEAGTPMIAQVVGLKAALDYIESLGRERIHAWETQLMQEVTKRLEALPGLRIIGTAPKKGGIVTFVVEGVHPLDLGTFLDAKGVAIRTGHLCAQPALARFGLTEAARVSFAPYNTLEEIDHFMEALESSLSLLR